MNRITALSFYFFLLLVLGCHVQPDPAPPNIALIMVDDVSARELPCYGATGILEKREELEKLLNAHIHLPTP